MITVVKDMSTSANVSLPLAAWADIASRVRSCKLTCCGAFGCLSIALPGNSSVGRAPALQAGCRGFESHFLHRPLVGQFVSPLCTACRCRLSPASSAAA